MCKYSSPASRFFRLVNARSAEGYSRLCELSIEGGGRPLLPSEDVAEQKFIPALYEAGSLGL